MARIPLRAYAREVENLIEHGQIEEAIAHAKNILKQFPKYIEAYRLLAKAYLESQRYTEAMDILQRILSVFPDDFIAHLGMSIIREDEGNLDAAIWHMERAYEVQPFNRAVQDELRRLYGRRDGVEPPRIRLTRGALVRMYDRGNLYPQAIAEIRAALAEDGARLDLLVLLARMYYLSGQKIEAAEVASSLISKLPYCFEANRILADVLPETSRAGDAPLFKQRLLALDPYLGFISPNAPTSEQVPEQTVMVEHLDWAPSMMEEAAPEWAKTIGVEWEESSQEEELPDWLNALAQPTEIPGTPSLSPAPTSPPPPSPEEVLPDFLKSAGWTPSQGENLEAERGTLFGEELGEEIPEVEAEPVEAEIPDWLKSLAPVSPEEPGESPEPVQEEERLDWLEEILPPPSSVQGIKEEKEEGLAEDWFFPAEATEEPPAHPESREEVAFGAEPLPDWLKAEIPATESLPSEPAEELPEWLRTAEGESTPEVKGEKFPDWLQASSLEESIEMAEPGIAPESTEAPPSWIETPPSFVEKQTTPYVEEQQPEIAEWLPESEEIPSPTETEQVPESPTLLEEIPSKFEESFQPQEESVAFPESKIGLSEPPPEDLDAALAWMEALAARQGAPEETLTISSPEQRTEEIPDWLKGQIEQTLLAEEEKAVELQEAQIPSEPLPELIAEETETVIEEPSQPEVAQKAEIEVTEQSPNLTDLDAALAWMEALAARQGAEPETLTITPPEQRQETPPEWIREELQGVESAVAPEVSVSEELHPPVPPIAEESKGIPSVSVEKSLEEMSPDEAFAWLESLAARQGAQEGTLFTPEEERPEAPPVPEAPPAEEIVETEEVTLPAIEEKAEEWVPEETISGIITEQPASAEIGEATAEEIISGEEVEIPEWLRSYEEEQKSQPPAWEPATLEINPEEVPDEALPEWLRVTPAETEPELTPTETWETKPSASLEASISSTESPATTEIQYFGEGEPSSGWLAIQAGEISKAVDSYATLIETGNNLEKVIQELEEALKYHPGEVTLWQMLGDAYFKADQVAKALDAYLKAEELLR